MSGRQTYRARCAAEGCPESAFYDGMTVREVREMAQRNASNPWRCVRHSRPDEVLSPDHRTITATATASRLIEGSAKLFWVQEGRGTGSGFTHGPGFKAFADDFPEGTRLVITAAIETPEATP